ncbi:hypothetical protein MTO96_009989 [Rhipicephalus appendiculatus]
MFTPYTDDQRSTASLSSHPANPTNARHNVYKFGAPYTGGNTEAIPQQPPHIAWNHAMGAVGPSMAGSDAFAFAAAEHWALLLPMASGCDASSPSGDRNNRLRAGPNGWENGASAIEAAPE